MRLFNGPLRLPLCPLIAALAVCLLGLPAEAAPKNAKSEQSVLRATATAAKKLQLTIRVVEQRPYLIRHRLEIQVLGGVGVSDTMYTHGLVGGHLRYHLTEHWAVAGSYAYYFSKDSQTFHDVSDKFGLYPERAAVLWSAGADVSWIPIHGKFDLFGQSIVHFDITLMAGGGVLQTARSSKIKPAGMLGIGWRIYATRWLALWTEFRDHIYVENFNAGSQVMNHVVFQVGLGFFIPFSPTYHFPR